VGVHIDNDCDFFGRTFTASDFQLMRSIVRGFQELALTELAKTLCELLDWRRPNGKLKHIECRSMLEQLQGG
jgi:hypothetical protein